MTNDFNLPNPYPRTPARLADSGFAVLGWLYRAAAAAGSDRFDEAITRARFYLDRAAARCKTPAEQAVLAGLSVSVAALVAADADMRELLADAVAGISEACASECDQLLEPAEG